MLNRAASFFSYLLHPMFMPTYGFMLLLFTNNPYSFVFSLSVKLQLLAIVFAFTCVLPVINLFVLLRLRLVNSLKLDNSRERTFPYIVTAVFYLGMVYLIWDFRISFLFKGLVAAGALSILLTSLINLRWKISAHMVGIGGLSGSLLYSSWVLQQNFLLWISVLFAAAGLLGFSRLQLKAHSPAQVYAGYILGAGVSFLFLFVLYIVDLYLNF